MPTNTIPLTKIAELRQTRRKYSLKTQEEYESSKQAFIASKSPRQADTAPSPQTTKTIEMMTDTTVKIFYGDYSQSDEDPTAWMQGLNTRKVVNDWTDAKAIRIFESLLAEEKRAYRWWHEDLRATDPTMDRENWTTVRKAFKERWPPLPEPEEDTESK